MNSETQFGFWRFSFSFWVRIIWTFDGKGKKYKNVSFVTDLDIGSVKVVCVLLTVNMSGFIRSGFLNKSFVAQIRKSIITILAWYLDKLEGEDQCYLRLRKTEERWKILGVTCAVPSFISLQSFFMRRNLINQDDVKKDQHPFGPSSLPKGISRKDDNTQWSTMENDRPFRVLYM